MENLMVEYFNLTNKLKVIDILKAIRISARQIEIEKFNGDYYLININIKEKLVNILTFKKRDYEIASEEYLRLEKDIKENENAVVFVSASSIKLLKKAYPSYFLDTSEFILALERINENCEKLKLVE
jgi:putative GTP pyrophosphokinase